jgi:hypothetical protein
VLLIWQRQVTYDREIRFHAAQSYNLLMIGVTSRYHSQSRRGKIVSDNGCSQQLWHPSTCCLRAPQTNGRPCAGLNRRSLPGNQVVLGQRQSILFRQHAIPSRTGRNDSRSRTFFLTARIGTAVVSILAFQPRRLRLLSENLEQVVSIIPRWRPSTSSDAFGPGA